jgi:hypothetical protein
VTAEFVFAPISAPDGDILTTALAWRAAGCSVVPTRTDGSKAPKGNWKRSQTERATPEQIATWAATHPNLGIVTGAVSDNLVGLELEGRAVAAGMLARAGEIAMAAGDADLWRRVFNGYLERSPSNGVHTFVHIELADGACPGSQKLASRPRADGGIEVLAETRGEGAFMIVAPSGGPTHPNGQPWTLLVGGPATIARVTLDEFHRLCAILRALDETPAAPDLPAPSSSSPSPRAEGERTPGDDYNERTSWAELLNRHGWKLVRQRGQTCDWRRPGKADGISATTGYGEHDLLYVFSTSTEFDSERSHSKFAAMAVLEHDGDMSAAARALRRDGYGAQQVAVDAGLAPLRPFVADLQAPAPVRGEPVADAVDFWQQRPELAHIRDFARARMTSPWAVFGVVLCRVLTAVPPQMVLPPIVGSHASLNFFTATVGASGAGKGASESAAADAFTGPHVEVFGPGSGEGIGYLFGHSDKDGKSVRDRTAVMLSAAEIDNVDALRSRQSSTLMPTLRSTWSGEALGNANVAKDRRVRIARHTYRLTFVVGVQPRRARALLDDADGGTPQRFLWTPATDPGAPDVTPAEPQPLPMPESLTGPWPSAGRGLHSLPVPEAAITTIREARLSRLRGDGEALDGHALLTRLKVAAGLAILNGRRAVVDTDWTLAGMVMAVSDFTRASVVDELGQADANANEARGRSEGARAAIAAETVDARAVKRIAARVRAGLAETGECSRSAARRRVTARDRQHFDEAVERLIAAGQVVETGIDHGALLRLTVAP